ncbi:MAG: hydroxymethylbilane synthase [Francisellaceae bacterium]
MKKLIIVSRASRLALWQSEYIKTQLLAHFPELKIKIITTDTEGDRILDRPLSQIGGKALFMKELETAILEGQAHIAVHSLKDVPYELPEGFQLSAFSKREDPCDAFISNHFNTIDELPVDAVVGTSSLRRAAQLLNHRPDLIIKDLRGNVETRLRKLDEGQYDAIVLASAGLIRLGLLHRITQFIDQNLCLPAVGQGIIVVESLKKDEKLSAYLSVINDPESWRSSMAERAFNARLQGGCQVAIAAYAKAEKDQLRLTAMVASRDGKELLKKSLTGTDPAKLGNELAQLMINEGAFEILNH